MSKKRPARKCQHCHERFKPAARGPLPKFCSPACRQRAFEARRLKELTSGYRASMRRDLFTIRVQMIVREEVARILTGLGILPEKPRGKVLPFKAVTKDETAEP
jgi:Fe-S-cluster-containing dehydrogenase component